MNNNDDNILKQINLKLINFEIRKPIIDKQEELNKIYECLEFSFEAFVNNIVNFDDPKIVMTGLEIAIQKFIHEIQYNGQLWELFEVCSKDELEKKLYQYIAVSTPKYIFSIQQEMQKDQIVNSMFYNMDSFPGTEH